MRVLSVPEGEPAAFLARIDGRFLEPQPDDPASDPPDGDAVDPDLTLVTLVFDSADPEHLLQVLSKYVVMGRGHPGCRNIDLTASATVPGRFVIIEKWASALAQQAHFDSPDMVEMATACTGLLRSPPRIDLLYGISAHDLA